jgi:hypothetical protein
MLPTRSVTHQVKPQGDQLAVLIDDPDCGVGNLDDDGLASVAETDLDALAGDLDAAPAGDPPQTACQMGCSLRRTRHIRSSRPRTV